MEEPHDTTPRLGFGMSIIAWSLALAMVAMLMDGLIEEWQHPNRDLSGRLENGIAVLELKRNRAGHYLAEGRINGQPVDFLLDTGASDVAIPADLGQRLGLQPGMVQEYETANGTIRAHMTRIDTLELGTIRLHDVRASLLPMPGDQVVLLGMSALKQLELVQRGETLTLRQYPQAD